MTEKIARVNITVAHSAATFDTTVYTKRATTQPKWRPYENLISVLLWFALCKLLHDEDYDDDDDDGDGDKVCNWVSVCPRDKFRSTSVRENVCNLSKNVKSHVFFLNFQKKTLKT